MTYRLPSLNALRAFEAAARHLSFKMAASELAVTAGAVSPQVKKLEASLGVALFRRLPPVQGHTGGLAGAHRIEFVTLGAGHPGQYQAVEFTHAAVSAAMAAVPPYRFPPGRQPQAR